MAERRTMDHVNRAAEAVAIRAAAIRQAHLDHLAEVDAAAHAVHEQIDAAREADHA